MADRRGRRGPDKLSQGYGSTFEEAVQDALKGRRFRKGGLGDGRAEVIFSEIFRSSPDEYHVIVRFPSN